MFERSCLRQRRLFTFVCYYAFREVSCEMLTNGWRTSIDFLKIVFSPLSAHGVKPYFHRMHSQRGKVTFGNTFKVPLKGWGNPRTQYRGGSRIFEKGGPS